MSRPVKKPALAAKATINCQGRRLPVGLSESGEALPVGHTAADALRISNYIAIGGRPCLCLEFAEFWKDLARGMGIQAARLGFAAAAHAFEVGEAALEMSRRTIDPLAELPLHKRPEFLGPFVGRLLRDHCDVPRDVRLTVKSRGDPWSYLFLLKRGRSELLRARIASSWTDDVFRMGLAVVEGVLTLRTVTYAYGVARRGGHRIERVVLRRADDGSPTFALERASVLPAEDGVFRVAPAKSVRTK